MFHYSGGTEYFDFHPKTAFHLEVSCMFQLLLNAKIDSKYVNNFFLWFHRDISEQKKYLNSKTLP